MANRQAGVAAVDRAMSILRAFTESDVSVRLADLARRTGMYKSTILRLCASLESAGFLRRHQDGSFSLGPELLKLGTYYQNSFDLGAYVMPVLLRLTDKTGESSSYYVRDGDIRICLFRVNSRTNRVMHYRQVGDQLPVDSGASGTVLRAFTEPDNELLESARRDLLITSTRPESETAAIAAPVFSAQNGLIGSISVAGPKGRFSKSAAREMMLDVLAGAIELTRALGGDARALLLKLESLTT